MTEDHGVTAPGPDFLFHPPARMSGEPDAVADAIFEHYLPRSKGKIRFTLYAAEDFAEGEPEPLTGVLARLAALVELQARGQSRSAA